jgi:uncharacterized protein YecE (DUF72 family)
MGWNYRHWEGVVYPKFPRRSFHPVEFLAERFDAVEIDQTFSRFLRPELSRLWAAKAAHNPGFQFTARLHRQFTHERNLAAGDIRRFSAGLDPLLDQGKLGCVVMQFPMSFRFTVENRAFLIQVRRAFHHLPLVAELRHRTWALEEAIGTLLDYHIGICNLDQPHHVRAMPPAAHLTWKVGYVKFYGRTPGAPTDGFFEDEAAAAGKQYLYSLADLEEWKQRVERMARFSERTFVVFANHGGGKSVINAMQMQGLLGGVEERRATPVPAGAAPSLMAVA